MIYIQSISGCRMKNSTSKMASWIITSSLSLLVLIFFVFLIAKKKKQRLPPGPPALPIIGNLHQLGPLPHRTLWRLSEKYGPLIYLKLGSVPTIVASSPETAKQILKTHDVDCCSRPCLAGTGKLSYNYLDVAFSPYDDYWREVRKICVLELFSVKRVQSFRFIREEEIDSLIRSISQHASSGRAINLSENLLSLTASVICRVAFGMSFRGSKIDNERLQEVVEEANAMLGSFSASDFFPYVGWIVDRLTGLYGRRERSFRNLDAFYEQSIKHHLENKRQEGRLEDIVDVLLKIEKEQAGVGAKRLTRNHVKGILMDVFIAGIDTSALALTWVMTELIRNPRVMKKVQSEIRNHIGNKRKVTEDDLDKLEYLKMVTKETWRLHPPGTLLLPREAMSKFQINGYDINPKTRIQVNVWAIGRDPKVWKDPEEFLPERFIGNPIDLKGQNFELLPFGGGRRGCPGMHMGMVMVELTLANLLYSFDWMLPEGMTEENVDMEEASGLTAPKKVPLELVPLKHTWT